MGKIVNLREVKIKLRNNYKKFRTDLTTEQKNEYDNKIFNRVSEMWSFKEEETLFTYVSTDTEIDTKQIIEHALSIGKKVAVPYCIDNSFEMKFYYINGFQDLQVRTFGVLEPIAEKCELVNDLSKGFCIVPALAYDIFGYRLGYGKGYYDRFLSKFKGTTVGLCYSQCVTNQLPHGKYDRSVNLIVTEKYLKPTER